MRYLITGGSGYIGTRLVDLLARREDTEKIVIADVVPPRGGYRPKTEFERVDVRTVSINGPNALMPSIFVSLSTSGFSRRALSPASRRAANVSTRSASYGTSTVTMASEYSFE